MNARAAASPRVAEEQRVQARNRSIARRATYSAEEAEQHLALARQKYSREKASKKTHLKQKQEQSQCAEVEWPTPADMERKTKLSQKLHSENVHELSSARRVWSLQYSLLQTGSTVCTCGSNSID